MNDATFRAANERIHDAAVENAFTAPVPFLCECADPRCRTILTVPLDAYERVRSNSRRFFVAPGHEGGAGPGADVVSTEDGYAVVEKTGRAGEIADRLDERANE